MSMHKVFFVFSVTVSTLLTVPVYSAQDPQTPPPFACVMKDDGVGGTLRLPIKRTHLEKFLTKMFVETDCSTDLAEKRVWAQTFCNITRSYSPNMARHFKNLYGLSPAEICETVQADAQAQ